MSLEHLVALKQYVPSVYEGVKEMGVLTDVQENWFKILIGIMDKEYARMFIQTSDEVGVARFESVLKITADPKTESLDFRKQRLLTRCNATLPYSTIWLKVYLNAIIGEQNYELDIDYDNDIITLYGYLLNYEWAKEFNTVIRDIKPCNMVFINIPTVIENIEFQIWQDENTWNHDIWHDENIWNEFNIIPKDSLPNYTKLPEGHPNIQTLLNELGSIKLNGTVTINELNIKVQKETIYIEFIVPEDVKLLTYVEIVDKKDITLLYTPCYIDTSPKDTKLVVRITCYEKKEN